MRPLGDTILIEQEAAEEVSAGGIVIPHQAQERPRIGKVLAVGPGRVLECGTRYQEKVAVGDRVAINAWAGNTFTVDGKEVLAIQTQDILFVL